MAVDIVVTLTWGKAEHIGVVGSVYTNTVILTVAAHFPFRVHSTERIELVTVAKHTVLIPEPIDNEVKACGKFRGFESLVKFVPRGKELFSVRAEVCSHITDKSRLHTYLLTLPICVEFFNGIKCTENKVVLVDFVIHTLKHIIHKAEFGFTIGDLGGKIAVNENLQSAAVHIGCDLVCIYHFHFVSPRNLF